MSSSRRSTRDESGAMLIIVALSMVVTMGFAALVIDGGNGRQAQRQAQAAADAAALAGAQVLSENGTAAQAKSTASSFATHNGFTGATVDIPPPAGSGAFAGYSNCVYVKTSQLQPKYFSGAVGSVSITAGGAATACYRSGSTVQYGIIALNTTACASLYNDANGSGAVISGSASIFVASTCSSDAYDNVGHLTISPPSVINVVGGQAGGCLYGNGSKCTPKTGITEPSPVDPLAATVTAPPARTTPTRTYTSGLVSYSPGYYNCKLTITASTTFSPGNYNITGGLVFNDNGGTVTFGNASATTYFTLGGIGYDDATNKGAQFTSTASTGVLFYLKGTTGCPAFVTDSNGDNYSLYPPASGIDQGLTVWVDSSVTACDSQSSPAVSCSGNSGGFGLEGTVYAPSGQVIITANGGSADVGAIVADKVAFVSKTSLDVTVGGLSEANTRYVTLDQ